MLDFSKRMKKFSSVNFGFGIRLINLIIYNTYKTKLKLFRKTNEIIRVMEDFNSL